MYDSEQWTQRMWMEVVVVKFNVLLQIFLERLRKTMIHLNPDSEYSDWDSNFAHLEYDLGTSALEPTSWAMLRSGEYIHMSFIWLPISLQLSSWQTPVFVFTATSLRSSAYFCTCQSLFLLTIARRTQRPLHSNTFIRIPATVMSQQRELISMYRRVRAPPPWLWAS